MITPLGLAALGMPICFMGICVRFGSAIWHIRSEPGKDGLSKGQCPNGLCKTYMDV